IYIGTNDFAPNTPGGGATFKGTTLNVIPIDSIFAASGPSVANMKKFVSPLSAGLAGEGGYAIQGVNSKSADGTGTVFSASLYVYDTLSYDITGLTSSSATGGTKTATIYSGDAGYTGAGPARQPADIAANRRIIDTLDDRVSSSVYEHNGMIYAVHTVNPTGDAAGDYARVRVVVLDATTKALIDTYDIGTGPYDYYQGSLAVNEAGVIVVGFNRSGLDANDGKIRFSAVLLSQHANGTLYQYGDEILLKESLTNDYHNGSLKGQAAAGRQRWGDYSQVSLDPTDNSRFYAIGQFAREYNTPADGHPGGTGGSRWSTWVGVINAAGVPEPSTWAMLILGFGVIGGAVRRQKREANTRERFGDMSLHSRTFRLTRKSSQIANTENC
ncbi:PEP-CTERM sorting domain-containing protein, partial [bacterium]